MAPKTSEMIGHLRGALKLCVKEERSLGRAEIDRIARLLDYFAGSCRQMEQRLAGGACFTEGGNVVSLAAYTEAHGKAERLPSGMSGH